MTAFFDTASAKVRSIPSGDGWLGEAAAIEDAAFAVIRRNLMDPDFPEGLRAKGLRIMEELSVNSEGGRRRALATSDLPALRQLHQMFHEVGSGGALIRGQYPWSDKPDENLGLIESLG